MPKIPFAKTGAIRIFKELIETVEYLKEHKISLMSLERKNRYVFCCRRVDISYICAIAHFERRLIGERSKEGINAARIKGRITGRPALDKEKLTQH